MKDGLEHSGLACQVSTLLTNHLARATECGGNEAAGNEALQEVSRHATPRVSRQATPRVMRIASLINWSCLITHTLVQAIQRLGKSADITL